MDENLQVPQQEPSQSPAPAPVLSGPEYSPKHYSKKNIWKWVLLCLLIVLVACGVVYYFFFYNKDSYEENLQNYQVQDSQNTTNLSSELSITSQQDIEIWYVGDENPLTISWEPKEKSIKTIEFVGVDLKDSNGDGVPECKLGEGLPLYDPTVPGLTEFNHGKLSAGQFQIAANRLGLLVESISLFVKITANDGTFAMSKAPGVFVIDASTRALVSDSSLEAMRVQLRSFCNFDPKTNAFTPAQKYTPDLSKTSATVKDFSLLPFNSEESTADLIKLLGINKTAKELQSLSKTFSFGVTYPINLGGKQINFRVTDIKMDSTETKELCTQDGSFCNPTRDYIFLEVDGVPRKMWRGEWFQLILSDGSKFFVSAADIEPISRPSDFIILDSK